jgi:hypothetical protein
MRDEIEKISMEDKTKRRLLGALRTTSAAALGAGLGFGVHGLIRGAAAKKLGPKGTFEIASKITRHPLFLIGSALATAGSEAALRHAIAKERKRYEDDVDDPNH